MLKRFLACLLGLVLAGCATSAGTTTVATKQLEKDILKSIVTHGAATGRKYSDLDVAKKPLNEESGTVQELWSIRRRWTDQWDSYRVSMTPDQNGETDFTVEEINQASASQTESH